MKKIGIIGGGFAGTMTAIQVIYKSKKPYEIILINEEETLNKGIAYNPYSEKHLLNVTAGKMSAFPDSPDHFINWLMSMPSFKEKDRTLVTNSFLPRKIYGEYLNSIWEECLKTGTSKQFKVSVKNSSVIDLSIKNDHINLSLLNDEELKVDYCIITTGNQIPRNPHIKNQNFYYSKNYFQNPWKIESVKNTKDDLPILIIGNGLTMVDTVIGLLEHGFKGEIFSISPNGFNILSHRHSTIKYSKLIEDLEKLDNKINLYEIVRLVNIHIKLVRDFGISAEPIIDSLRPFTQKIWKSLSEKEKKIFMSRLRHLWGVARHRIPLHTYDKIQQLRIDKLLHIISGKIIDISEKNEIIIVEYFDKKENIIKMVNVSRVINCTGPETDLMNLENHFLKNSLQKGIIAQDELKLGINTDTETFQIKNPKGIPHKNLFTIGSNLKGELWESTAVNEIRVQAEKLSEQLISQISS